MANPPGKCIFCGGGGLSKEHIIAEWVQSVVPKDNSGATHLLASWGFDSAVPGRVKGLPPRTSARPRRQGDVLNIKLRCVCRPCNHGWMGKLQERAKPFLVPLLTGQWTELSPEGQATVSAWIAMTVMVNEFSDPYTIAITQEERSQFMETKVPRQDWWIAIGVLPRDGREIMHTGATIWSGKRPDPSVTKNNTHVDTAAVGRLIFQAFGSTVASIHPTPQDVARLGLVRIWPPEVDAVRPPRTLNEREAAYVSVALRQSLASSF